MIENLKKGLVDRLKQVGAYDVRVADPNVGFEHALPERHPMEVWNQCKSVVVFAIACSPKTNNTYLGPFSPWEGFRGLGPVPVDIQSEQYAMDRLSNFFISSVTLKGMTFLHQNGFQVSFSQPQLKLSAYEAGLGVYGRFGAIINPFIGDRMQLGAILTDAILEPDGRLEDFNPCENCDLCIKSCPAKAFDPAKTYPESYSRDMCIAKRQEIAEEGLYCHNCWAVCPACTLNDDELLCIEEATSIFSQSD